MPRDPSPVLEHCKRTALPCPCGSRRQFVDCCDGLVDLLGPPTPGSDPRLRLWFALMLCWFPHRLGPPGEVRDRIARLIGRPGTVEGAPCWLLAVLPGPDCPPDEPVVALDRLMWEPWRDGRPILRWLTDPPGQSTRRASRASTASARRTGTRHAASDTARSTAPTPT